MKTLFRLFFACLLAIALPVRADTINVFAAASLTDALKEIEKNYGSKSTDELACNFAGSNVLAKQIEQGAPADIFFSADEPQMDNVAKAGLVDPATRHDVLENTLVVVAPIDSPLATFKPADLTKPGIKRIALADPKAVPAGVYAKVYLTRLGIWGQIQAKVVPTANVRAALAAVESGEVEVGLVYQTDANASKRTKVIYAVPQGDGPPIKYPVALMKASGKESAKKFLTYLESPEALAVFKKHGFLTSGK